MSEDVRKIGGKPAHVYTCQEVAATVEDFLDQECTTEVRAMLEEHVDACPECFERLGVERELRLLIKQSCSPKSTPRELREKVIAKLQMIHIEGCTP